MVDFSQAGFHHSRYQREGRHHHGGNGCRGAHLGAHDELTQGQGDDEQDQEGDTSQQVNHTVEQSHHPAGQGADSVLLSRDQQHTQGQADGICENHLQQQRIQGLPGGEAVLAGNDLQLLRHLGCIRKHIKHLPHLLCRNALVVV